jgi:hypothetical protein
MKRLPVFDVVAEDWWEYTWEDSVYVAHVSVGRPRKGDEGWSCPLRIEGAHEVWNPFSQHRRWKGWKPIAGTGPFDALMNALLFAFRLFAERKPRSVAAPIRELERAERRKVAKPRRRHRR